MPNSILPLILVGQVYLKGTFPGECTASDYIYLLFVFVYVYFSEQQPLKLNSVEVCEVIAAVCSETPSPNTNLMTVSSKLSSSSGKPSMDVAVSVLIKLVIDMYVFNPFVYFYCFILFFPLTKVIMFFRSILYNLHPNILSKNFRKQDLKKPIL